ncbi:MAG: MFS transporter [Pseudomonadota bacterium]
MAQAQAAEPAEPAGTFAPLGVAVFRRFWFANVASNFGSLIQAVGAAWLMTLIASSDTQVALVQASTTLPVMMLSLVTGAMADRYDRRRLMLWSTLFMLSVSVALTVCAYLDLLSAWGLLGFTFLIGCGFAVHNPAWQASVRDFVGMRMLPQAVLLNGMGFNVTRSVAPALGGIVVATLGAAVAFAINAASYLGLLFAIFRWSGSEGDERRDLQPEGLRAAIRAGVRYAGSSPHLLRLYSRGFAFGAGAIALLALLPLVARDQLGGDSLTFGLLLGAFGLGAVGGGLVSNALRKRLTSEQMVRLAFIVLVFVLLLVSLSRWLLLSMPIVALGGGAWVLALAFFNTSVQLSTPRWVVGRALSLYQMTTFGGMALGSWVWGLWVTHYSLPIALQIAAGALLIGLSLGFRWPLTDRTALNLDPLDRWREPDVALDIVPRSGPIALAIEYLIDPDDVPEFMAAMQERQRIRRRDGARMWKLYRDLERTELWIERFELPTWADYVRFHSRTTQEDGEVLDRARALHRGEARPRVRRMLVRDPGDTRFGRPGETPDLGALALTDRSP